MAPHRRNLLAATIVLILIASWFLYNTPFEFQKNPELSGFFSRKLPVIASEVSEESAIETVEDGLPPALERLIVVTASSSNHFCWTSNMIVTVRTKDPTARIVLYDLGHTDAEIEWYQSVDGLEYRKFNFSKYPKHFDINVAAGEYAWKPVIIAEVLEIAEHVVWMDGGDKLDASMDPLIPWLDRNGFFTEGSRDSLQRWAHPDMLKYLKVDESLYGYGNCNGAFMGFSRTKVKDTLVKKWVECAMVKECIAPEGSSRSNHRQDQAVITALVAMTRGQYECTTNPPAPMYHIHMDYSGEPCPNPAGSFAVGIPTNLNLVANFMSRALSKLPGNSTSLSLGATIVVRLATLLPISHDKGPHVLVTGRSVTTALLHLTQIFAKNTLLVALSFQHSIDSLLLPLMKSSSKSSALNSYELTKHTGPVEGPLHFIGLPITSTPSLELSKQWIEIVFKEYSRFNIIYIISPLTSAAGTPVNIKKEIDFVVHDEIGQKLVDWNSPAFAVWDLQDQDLPSGMSAALTDFNAISNALPSKMQTTVIQVNSHHCIFVLANFVIPRDIMLLQLASQAL